MLNKYDSHCEISNCICQHDNCYKGWIDNSQGNYTSPCPYCRDNLHARLFRADQAKAKGYPQPAYQRILSTLDKK